MTLEVSAVIGGQRTETITFTPEMLETVAEIGKALREGVDPETGEIIAPEVDPRKQLARDAAAIEGDLNTCIWKRAELGANAKNRGVKEWAAIIAVPARRSVRRVEEWAQTYEWAQDAGVIEWRAELDFTFFELARKYAKYSSVEEVVELLDTFRQEAGATAESFKKELDDLRGEPEVDLPKGWRKMAEKLFGQVDAEQPTVAECLQTAGRALLEAAERKLNQGK